MKPRMTTSKKWTPFPLELSEQINSIFSENFQKQVGAGQIIVEGRIYPEELLFRVGFLPSGRLFQANFEASICYIPFENIQKAIDLCLDATASMMEQYYESNERIDLPRHWSEFIFDKQKIYLQFSSTNTSLEAEADRLLGANASHLVNEIDESENLYEQANKHEGPSDDDSNQ